MSTFGGKLKGFMAEKAAEKEPVVSEPLPNMNVGIDEARTDPSKVHAQITRAEWADYMERFSPIEHEVLNDISSFDYTAAGDDAGQSFGQSFSLGEAQTSRRLRASGTSLTDGERAGLDRRRSLGLTAGIAGAETSARAGAKTDNDSLMRTMLGYGRASAITANSSLAAAGGMQNSREAAYLANKTAADAANRSSASQAVGLAMGIGAVALGL